MDEGEINMTNYEKHLEKVWRDGMVVGDIYNFIGKGTGGWRHRYTLIGFEGCGEDLLLIFKSAEHDTVFRIMANDIGAAHLFSKPTEEKKEETDMKFLDEFDEIFDKKIRKIMDQVHSLSSPGTLPEPMQLVKKIEGYKFDEKEFYRATNSVRHFVIKNSNNERYEAFYYGPTLDKAGMHITFARIVGCGNVTCESAELYHDKIKCDPVWTNFKLFKGDSLCTYDEIKMDDIFKKEEKLEWDIDKLKVGKAYRIRDIDGNETDGIYTRLYETAVPGQSSIVFAVVSDKGVVGTCHVYQEDLASGKIKIYELTCGKDGDEE
jgi:hypothetical protein